jgi:hypothetical protein
LRRLDRKELNQSLAKSFVHPGGLTKPKFIRQTIFVKEQPHIGVNQEIHPLLKNEIENSIPGPFWMIQSINKHLKSF